ncbi:MAG: extracellular solute-binding protein [Candidatus Promineifilaceae bacterium]
MTLIVSLLGPPEVRRDDEALVLPGHRPLALLAYLLVTGQPQRREHLVSLLFDRPHDPRAALRWSLSKLRRALGAEYLLADRDTVAFNFACDYQLDTEQFTSGDLSRYCGEFLEGLNLRDARQFDEWLLVQREYWRALLQAGLEKQLAVQIAARDAEGVEETAVKLLQLDNLREDWRRALMSAYSQQGKFEAALAQVDLNRQVLLEELQQEPAPETTALAQAITARRTAVYRTLSSDATSTLLSPPPMTLFPGDGADAARRETAEILSRGRKRPRRLALFAGLILVLLSAVVVYRLVTGRDLAHVGTWAAEGSGDEPVPGELAGTTVTVGGSFDKISLIYFEEAFRPLQEETGIQINLVDYGDDFQYVVDDVIVSELSPDIIIFSQPGYLADFVDQGRVIDVRSFMGDSFLQQQFSDSMLEAAMVHGQMAGLWYTVNIKSVVWYAKAAFDAAGYREPQTWEQLMALTEQIAADGQTPWCIGMELGAATGWVGTDWVENILLRTAPPETYDAWVAGDLPFDSPEIRRVFEIMSAIWLEDAYVHGGTAAISREDVTESFLGLFAEPPDCLLHSQGSFMLPAVPDGAQFGRDYDFFYLPPIDEEFGHPVLGGGEIMAMFHDRPEVRETMRFLASGKSTKPFVESTGNISPHRDAPFEWYSSPASLKMAQILFEADTYRFDGSDMMPVEVGQGAFWRGMVDWVEGEDLDTVLRKIDESWPVR